MCNDDDYDENNKLQEDVELLILRFNTIIVFKNKVLCGSTTAGTGMMIVKICWKAGRITDDDLSH